MISQASQPIKITPKIEYNVKCATEGCKNTCDRLIVGIGEPDKWHIHLGGWHCNVCIGAWEQKQNCSARLDHLSSLRTYGMISEQLVSSTFLASDKTKESLAYIQARRWNGYGNVFVYGPDYSGKTYLARCLLNKVFDVRYKGFNGYRPGLCESNAQRFVDATKGWEVDLSRFENTCGLLIDDIGHGDWTDRSFIYLRNVLGTRLEARRPTIIVSSWTKQGLIEHFTGFAKKNKELANSILLRLNPVAFCCDELAQPEPVAVSVAYEEKGIEQEELF